MRLWEPCCITTPAERLWGPLVVHSRPICRCGVSARPLPTAPWWAQLWVSSPSAEHTRRTGSSVSSLSTAEPAHDHRWQDGCDPFGK